ncbi:MAG TPA: glycosyltransferase [Actinomycetota bacterium]|jgi:trehalose synthase|nr:glycosyltransferase [Actinomycetota bacterium]
MRIVPSWPRSIDEFRSIVPNNVINDLQRLAWEQLRGKRVLHINSTEYGGGVAEILLAQVPLLDDLGMEATWGVIDGDEHFFEITKSVHNGFQGNKEIPWTGEMEDHYLAVVEQNLASLPGGYDIAVVHDPQPMAIPLLLGDKRFDIAKHWIWRCHIDCADPHGEIWGFVRRFLDPYEAMVFTMKEFVQPEVPGDRVTVSAPSIDPVSPKNSDLSDVTVNDICKQYHIDTRRPIMAQVSRFDPWKDPYGVIRAYKTVKEQIPEVQLILAGSLAHDDPEGLRLYDELLRERDDDRDVFILSNFQQVGNTTVNCFQRAADVVIQKSIREGFGLTVAEAAWKGKPVIGGRAGGITLQIDEGRTGFLVDSVEECAERTIELLRGPEAASAMGAAGRELVRDQFLTTREVADWLQLFADLAAN